MLDVLVALLLLAIVLTGTCGMLIQAVRASGDALRASQATDLAADLTEDLRGAGSLAQMEAVLASWRNRIATVLPVTGMEPEEFASLAPSPVEPVEDAATPVVSLLLLRLRWLAAGGVQRELVLPVAARGENPP